MIVEMLNLIGLVAVRRFPAKEAESLLTPLPALIAYQVITRVMLLRLSRERALRDACPGKWNRQTSGVPAPAVGEHRFQPPADG